jgi:hypothetical protein
MKLIHTATACLLLAAMATAAAVEITMPAEFNVNYDVYRSGIKIARMQRHFSRLDDGNLQYRSETNVTGLASIFRNDRIIEASTWQLNDGKIVPKLYEYQHTGTKRQRNVTVTFDWEQNEITNSVNGSTWKMPTTDGMLDKLLYQFSIMLDLQAGKSSLIYTIADGGTEKTYLFELLGEEVIDTPLGDLHTIKLIRRRADDRNNRQSIFWSAPALGYLPVKLEDVDDDEKTIVIINSLSGLGTPALSQK